MEKEEQRAITEWDENVRRRTFSSVSMRPGSGSSTPSDHHRLSPDLMTNGTGSRRSSGPASSDFPEVDVFNREDTLLNISCGDDNRNGSFDGDDAPKSPYVDSPRTGRRFFRVNFDVRGYDAKNIQVKLAGSRLVIHAIQNEQEGGRKSTTEYCRKVRIPSDVDMEGMKCFHTHDTLTVEAPVRQPVNVVIGRTASPVTQAASTTARPRREEPLNVAQLKMAPDGHYDVTLLVEVGRVFRADDITVKTAGPSSLVVVAQRNENNTTSRMTASLSREFDLPSKIVPETLKAGFMANGLLRVSARVARDDEMNGKLGSGNDNGAHTDSNGIAH